MNYQPRLKKEFSEKVREQLKGELKLDNVMAVPTLEKIILNIGIGDLKDDSGLREELAQDLELIAGQKAIVTKAKKAISNFKIRQGQEVGLKVTLRGVKMWEFFDRLVNVVLPRVKDFRGLSIKTFDGKGNYALGLREHIVFPEIDPNKVTRPHGMQLIICTTSENNAQSRSLLKILGMPFSKR